MFNESADISECVVVELDFFLCRHVAVIGYVNVVNPGVDDTVEPLLICFIVEIDFYCLLFNQLARKANRKHVRCCRKELDVKIFGNNEDVKVRRVATFIVRWFCRLYYANFLENAMRGYP